jgi:hypothetical protein
LSGWDCRAHFVFGFKGQRPPSSRRGLARARSLGRAAFGFAKFLSPFPKRLKSPPGEGESFAIFLKNRATGFAGRSSVNPKPANSYFPSSGERIKGEGGR